MMWPASRLMTCSKLYGLSRHVISLFFSFFFFFFFFLFIGFMLGEDRQEKTQGNAKEGR